MSADSHSVCPNCYPDLDDGVIDCTAEDLGLPHEVRENIEYYMEKIDGELFVVFRYDALCWECRWHKEIESVTSLSK